MTARSVLVPVDRSMYIRDKVQDMIDAEETEDGDFVPLLLKEILYDADRYWARLKDRPRRRRHRASDVRGAVDRLIDDIERCAVKDEDIATRLNELVSGAPWAKE